MDDKPLGRKNYGSIPHLPNSRRGPADRTCNHGQARIATERARDKHDEIFVQEKLDGSNVGVARIDGEIYPIGRAGYLANSSPHEQHRLFAAWAQYHAERFLDVLRDGERLVGEWLAQAHGTRYKLVHEPFVAFDLMTRDKRAPYDVFIQRIGGYFVTPTLIHRGCPLSVSAALVQLGVYGYHGALDPVEGAVWRIERDALIDKRGGQRERVVDFLVKFVRPDKVDGQYLPEIGGGEAIWNWRPKEGE